MRDELLGVDAKDADFLVPGLDIAQLRRALAPHGHTEELVVASRGGPSRAGRAVSTSGSS